MANSSDSDDNESMGDYSGDYSDESSGSDYDDECEPTGPFRDAIFSNGLEDTICDSLVSILQEDDLTCFQDMSILGDEIPSGVATGWETCPCSCLLIECIDDDSDDAWLSGEAGYSCEQLFGFGWCDDDETYAEQTQERCPFSCGECTDDDDECTNGHDDRPGNTSEERCIALDSCCYSAEDDDCSTCGDVITTTEAVSTTTEVVTTTTEVVTTTTEAVTTTAETTVVADCDQCVIDFEAVGGLCADFVTSITTGAGRNSTSLPTTCDHDECVGSLMYTCETVEIKINTQFSMTRSTFESLIDTFKQAYADTLSVNVSMVRMENIQEITTRRRLGVATTADVVITTTEMEDVDRLYAVVETETFSADVVTTLRTSNPSITEFETLSIESAVESTNPVTTTITEAVTTTTEAVIVAETTAVDDETEDPPITMIAGICAGVVVIAILVGCFLRKYFCSSGPKGPETQRINVNEQPEVEIPIMNKDQQGYEEMV